MRVSRRCRLPPLRLDAATLTPPVPVYCVLSIEVSCIEVQGIEVKGIEVQGIVRVVPSARARVAAHSCAPSPEGAADRPAPSSTATFKVSVPGRRPAPSLAVWAGGPHCSPLSLSVRLRHPHWHWECRRHAHTRGGSAPTVCSMALEIWPSPRESSCYPYVLNCPKCRFTPPSAPPALAIAPRPRFSAQRYPPTVTQTQRPARPVTRSTLVAAPAAPAGGY